MTKTNQKIPYYFNGNNLHINNTDYLIGMGLDITARKEIELELKESESKLRKLSNYLQTVREEERTSIAREIHDELGQQLTGLKMDSHWIMKKLDTQEQPMKERLEGMISLIDGTIKTVRRIASELRPGILDDLGLIAALEWQTQEFQKRSGVKASLKVNINDFDPSGDLSTTIFRVYQEALTNITRYAKATRVESVMEELNGNICLSIKDNGIGFDLEEAKIKNSLGLLGMKERAILFSGELVVASEKNKRTCITLKIPLLNIIKKNA